MDIRIKICGLTNLEDAQLAVDAGADMLGFIFYSKSPRAVGVEQVKQINEKLRIDQDKQVLKIGVFVNEEVHKIDAILRACDLDAAQLHGEEPPEYLKKEGNRGTGQSTLFGRAYKAIRPASLSEALDQAAEYALPEDVNEHGLPALLVDSYHPHLKGGTGIQADGSISKSLAEKYSILLAGGLNPGNVQEVVRSVIPWGIDVSSGIESSPGKKDHRALEEIIEKVKL